MFSGTLITPGLVLSRVPYREMDRLCVLYTQALGKVSVRFVGVNRPLGKLKALSEPMVQGEYRLFIRPKGEFIKAIGGSLVSTFPGIRCDFSKILHGLEVCELLDCLTPPWQPNPEKYALAVSALSVLEHCPQQSADWILSAFGLRLLELAGFGLYRSNVSEPNRALWNILHHGEFVELQSLPSDLERQGRLRGFLQKTVERIAQRPLKTAQMRFRLSPAFT